MASYHNKTVVYGSASKPDSNAKGQKRHNAYSPEKLNQFAAEFDDLIKNRHLHRQEIIAFSNSRSRSKNAKHSQGDQLANNSGNYPQPFRSL